MEYCSQLFIVSRMTSFGVMTAAASDTAIHALAFGDACSCTNPDKPEKSSQALMLIETLFSELEEYACRKRMAFSVPLEPHGTPFQTAVWNALCSIGYGQTCSYAQLARAAGHEGSWRAVGQAVHRNPVAILIPCHRIVGADGSLTGYAAGLERKKMLLALESENA